MNKEQKKEMKEALRAIAQRIVDKSDAAYFKQLREGKGEKPNK